MSPLRPWNEYQHHRTPVYRRNRHRQDCDGQPDGQSAPPAPTPTCGWTLAQWTFAGFTANPPPFPAANTQAADVTTVTVSVGGTSPGSLSAEANTGNGSVAAPSMLLYGWAKTAAIDPATSPYVQFAVDTSKYTSVQMQAQCLAQGQWPKQRCALLQRQRHHLGDPSSTFASTTSWAAYGPYIVTGASTTGVTYFRIYGNGANATSRGNDLNIDDVTFGGGKVPLPPTLNKSFVSPVVVNGVSRLTFSIGNPNSIQLTGVTFQDDLPSGVVVTIRRTLPLLARPGLSRRRGALPWPAGSSASNSAVASSPPIPPAQPRSTSR